MANTENEESPVSPRKIDTDNQSPNFFDKFFIAVTAFGFGLGTAIALLPDLSVATAVPAIFYGTGIGALVYRFMGGLKSDDSISTKTIKISGSLASLLGSIIIVNFLLEHQIRSYLAHADIHIKEVNGELRGEIQNNGHPISLGRLSPSSLIQVGYRNIATGNNVIEVLQDFKAKQGVTHPVLVRIRDECRNHRGFCAIPTEEFSLIIDSISSALKATETTVCYGSLDTFWADYQDSNLLIYKQPTEEKVQLKITNDGSTLPSGKQLGCFDQAGEDRRIIISQQDASSLQLKKGDRVKARTTE